MSTRWAVRADRAFDGSRFLSGGATVVIEGDRIAGVEPAAFELPSDVPVTDLAGTLLPGLVDCHVHFVSSGAFPGTPGSLEWSGTAEVSDTSPASPRAAHRPHRSCSTASPPRA